MNLFLKRRAIIYGTSLVIALILINTALIFYYRASIVSDNQIEEDTNAIVEETKGLLTGIVHQIDLGVRAYGITKNESMLTSIDDAIRDMNPAFDTLRTKLLSQGFDVAELEKLRLVFDDYIEFNKAMIDSVRAGNIDTFRQMVAEERGLKVHQEWLKVSEKILAFEADRNTTAVASFHEAISNMALLQFCTLLIGLPVLLFVVSRIKNNDRLQKQLLMSLDENNRKYIFDPGRQISTNDADQVIKSSIDNYREAAEFIKRISNGDFAVRWKGLDENNSAFNKENLAGELMKMLEKLKTVKHEDEKRFWITEGLSALMVNVRNNQDNLEKLAEESVRYIIKYVRAQQGSLFVVKQDHRDKYLDLAACYAFDRRKYITKRIEIGSGIIGQAYLEKETTLLRTVPDGYVHITSGLGHATPSCVVIVPMVHHENVEAILELAAFHVFEEHELTFLQKAAEFIASSLQSIKISESSSLILAESRQKAEELRANEEELRQNMEELAATQEEVQRVLAEVQKKESYLRNLLDASDDSIVTVDQRYTIIHCNKKALDGYRSAGVDLDRNSNLVQLIPIEEREVFKESIDRAFRGEVVRTHYNGALDTHFLVNYVPITNEDGQVMAVAQFSQEVTHLVRARKEAEDLLRESQLQTEEMRAQEEELRAIMEAEDSQKKEMTATIEKLRATEHESSRQIERLKAHEAEWQETQKSLRLEIASLRSVKEC